MTYAIHREQSQNAYVVSSPSGDTSVLFAGLNSVPATSVWISINRLRTLGNTITTDLLLRFNLDSSSSYIYDTGYKNHIWAGKAAGTSSCRPDGSQSFSFIHIQGLKELEYKTVSVYAGYNTQGIGLTPNVTTLKKRAIYKTSVVVSSLSFSLLDGTNIGQNSRFEVWVTQ